MLAAAPLVTAGDAAAGAAAPALRAATRDEDPRVSRTAQNALNKILKDGPAESYRKSKGAQGGILWGWYLDCLSADPTGVERVGTLDSWI